MKTHNLKKASVHILSRNTSSYSISSLTLDVPVHNLLVVEVLQPLQHLLGVEGDHPLVPLQRAPLGPEQGGEGAAGDLF